MSDMLENVYKYENSSWFLFWVRCLWCSRTDFSSFKQLRSRAWFYIQTVGRLWVEISALPGFILPPLTPDKWQITTYGSRLSSMDLAHMEALLHTLVCYYTRYRHKYLKCDHTVTRIIPAESPRQVISDGHTFPHTPWFSVTSVVAALLTRLSLFRPRRPDGPVRMVRGCRHRHGDRGEHTLAPAGQLVLLMCEIAQVL